MLTFSGKHKGRKSRPFSACNCLHCWFYDEKKGSNNFAKIVAAQIDVNHIPPKCNRMSLRRYNNEGLVDIWATLHPSILWFFAFLFLGIHSSAACSNVIRCNNSKLAVTCITIQWFQRFSVFCSCFIWSILGKCGETYFLSIFKTM